MSEVGEKMLAELKRIREALEGSQPLGFGKRQEPSYVFVKWDGKTVWYGRDKHEGVNRPIQERDLTGYLVNVWRFDRVDATTQEKVPRLNIQVRADKDYIIQTGFTTNFSKTFLAGLNELEPAALKEPITLVVETNEGSKHRLTLFCRVECRGERMTPAVGKGREPNELFEQAVARFGFTDPYAEERP
ncbi:MAG: hypothetical protein AVDCRST_MAG86-1972 [uncultured Truepera sp.]|uniref:Uncharacterized protein n=1 Tax=uncultured Truepera sp. TaxID=543023 RepID=A0A6J4VCV6_9DEIN|nr:MAG: hypothetical protein AVDCRST_MAG86-1972 [uncultured Truepera sp.]